MLSPSLIPTRLVLPHERARIVVVESRPPSRLRTLSVLVRMFGYLWTLIRLRFKGQLSGGSAGAALRASFERLGGLWLKVGQLLSLRIDLFPQEFCQELAKLQNRAVGFPTPLARQIIEQDLGAPIEQYFDEFVDQPFAVASIGQVHRARLRQEQIYVAVKVQKPYAPELFARDLVFVRWFVRLLQLMRFKRHMRWDLGYEELCEVMKEELDFHYEASSMRRMKVSLRGHRIYVPRVYSRYCSKRILVTEFIHAVLMADYIRAADTQPEKLAAWVTENNVDPRKVARRLIQSIFRQLLENNLYHGDLHPGNIVLLRDSQIALIDFGSTNFTEREYLQKFRMFVRALATRDYAKAADLCLMLTASLPNIDTDQVKEELVGALRSWATRTLVRELPYHDKSLDNATIQVVKILVEYRCTMEWAWLRVHRALTTLDTSLIYLYPKVNYTRVLQKYFQKAERRKLKSMLGLEMVRRSIGAFATSLDIQDRVNDYTIFQGQLVRRQAQVFRDATSKFTAIGSLVVEFVWVGFALIGLAGLLLYLDQRGRIALDNWLGPQITNVLHRMPPLDRPGWLLLLLGYLFILQTLVRVRRRLHQKDVRSHDRVAAV